MSGYRDVDFAHYRPEDIVELSQTFVPILSKVQIHLQQFKTGLLDFVYLILSKKFAKTLDTLLTKEVSDFKVLFEFKLLI